VCLAHGQGIAEAVGNARAYVAAGLRDAVEIGGGSLVIDYARAASAVVG
jgi:hydroxymethylpyrimidine/phosphomethylpyrimidine kinase